MMQPTEKSRAATRGNERFLVLPENQLAFAAMDRLITRGTLSTSLLYLYGPTGAGKSHLLRHFLREFRRHETSARAVSMTGSELAAEFAAAADKQEIAHFRERFHACELFLCEEIQSLGRRPETQRVLISLIDEIQSSGGRVVLTSDRLPSEVAGFQPRLVSRCHGGVSAGIAWPGPASRVQLLELFAAQRQIPITTDALRTLAEARPVSPRELQALLIQLEHAACHQKSRLDPAFISSFLKGDVQRPVPTLNDVAKAVARQFNVRVSDLRSSTRLHGLTMPRQCAMYLSRRLTEEPLVRIASYFGRKNHSAVIHACRRTLAALDDEPALRRNLIQIRTALGVPLHEPEGDRN